MKTVLLSSLICFGSTLAQDLNFAIGEWSPYVSESASDSKVLEQVVSEAYALSGIGINLRYFPWKRSYEYVKQGEFDGSFPWNKTPDRESLFTFHQIPLLSDKGVFFHLKTTDFNWQELSDLTDYKVGAVVGFKQVETYRNLDIPFEVIETEDAAFKMLVAGRIEVYQTSKTVGLATIKRLFPASVREQITYHAHPVETNEYFVLFNNALDDSQRMADQLDIGLKALIDNGRYEEIISSLE